MRRLKLFVKKRGCLLSIVLLALILLVIASPFMLRMYTDWRFADDHYTVQSAPERPVAIVFGARVLGNGRLSTMLYDRVATAADLYHTGKVDYLLLTGDNREESYDEPGAMRRMLLRMGVPDSALILDPAGLRTYDSCYRARYVYEVESAILVTQAFHLDRALLLCSEMEMDVVGVPADFNRPEGYRSGSLRWLHLREVGATMLAFADLIRRPDPEILDQGQPAMQN